MNAIPLEDAIERESTGARVPHQAAAESACVLPCRRRRRYRRDGTIPRAARSDDRQLGRVRNPGGQRRAGAVLRRAHAGEQELPHDRRLPDRRRAAVAAGVPRGAAADPARTGVAAKPPRLVHPVVQPPGLHDRDDVGVGGGAPGERRDRPDPERRGSVRARRHGGLGRARRAQRVADRTDDPLGQRTPDAPAVLVSDALDGVRLRRRWESSSPPSGRATRGSSRSRSPRCC